MTSTVRRGRNQISLARALSKFGIASRSKSVRMIADGHVAVNGRTVVHAGRWVDPRVDRITVDGMPIRKQAPVYLAMNKPAGIVTTRSDERGRSTVYHILPAAYRWVFPVGRLDKDTSGLLLLTNDTQFGERVTNPLDGIPKTYDVEVDTPLTEESARRFRSGIILRDGTRCRPAVVRFHGRNRLSFDLTITEGMNRQVRRMCDELGYAVIGLRRTRIGKIDLGALPEGQVRTLKPEEISSILGV